MTPTDEGGRKEENVLRERCWNNPYRDRSKARERIKIEQTSSSCGLPVFPEYRGRFIRNDGKSSPDYTASYLGRHYSPH
jgi:hypothetical protein